jgi:hypothetical protein
MFKFLERFSDFQASTFLGDLLMFLECFYHSLEDLWDLLITRHLLRKRGRWFIEEGLRYKRDIIET